VSNAELRQRAEALGVQVTYWDWQGRETTVPDETLQAIAVALEDVPPAPAARAGAAGEPAVAPVPGQRSWGFTVQLYSLRSRASWGQGDLRDLAEFAAWAARDLGAGFVLINPLHAAEPLPPVSPSPYLPMSRRWISPLYLRIEDIPEFAELNFPEHTRLTALGNPLRAASGTAALIDRDAVWLAKRTALEIVRKVPLSPPRQASLDAFRVRNGPALDDWGTWCAFAEVHGPDYRTWPVPLRDHRSAETYVLRGDLSTRVDFHVWVQWLVAEQTAAAQASARAAGMPIGIVADLAVGAHPGGADAWAGQHVYVPGFSVGAPPDEFNQRGQDWTLMPPHPGRLAALSYRPLADLVGSAFGLAPDGAALGGAPSAGGLRIDHTMGLSRLWWIPAGQPPWAGAYVRYDAEATIGAVVASATAAGAVAIGEDLGTVERGLQAYLAEHGVLGTTVLWFAAAPDGAPLPPGDWRRGCMATVGTHDVPTVAGFWTGDQVTVRAGLGLLTGPESEERERSAATVSAWLAALTAAGLVPPDGPRGIAEFTVGLYGYLARTPALLVGVSLADAVGDTRSQNIPGTVDQYPNWRIPLCDEIGQPVLIEDLPGHPLVRAVVRAVSGVSKAG